MSEESPVVQVEIYTSPFCPFCWRAKQLLKSKGVEFDEIDVMMNPGARREMTERAGSHTVPQVFVDGVHIGDCNGIYALDADGRLDAELGIEA